MLPQATDPISLLLFLVVTCAFVYTVLCIVDARPAAAEGARSSSLEAPLFALVGTAIAYGWIATLLISVGHFTMGRVTAIALFAAGLTLIVRRMSGRAIVPAPLRRPDRIDWMAIALLIICGLLYFRPHEYVLGGGDAGTYMNMAAYAARTGEVVERSEWTANLVEWRQETLREQRPGVKTRLLQFVGWYIDDDDPARTLPQFYLFHPALLAIGVSLGGLWGGLLVTPLWGVLSVAAVYLCARRVFDGRVALLAALLLAVTPTHIFFSRYPTTEPLTLLLLFAGLLAFQRLWDGADKATAWGIFGGAAIGAALLTRIDLPLIVAAVLAGILWRRFDGHWHRGWTAFCITLSLFIAQLIYLILYINWPYFWNVNRAIMIMVGDVVVFGAAAVIAGLLLLIVLWRRGALRRNGPLRRALTSPWARWSIIAIVIGLSLYAYFVRPVVEPIRYVKSWPAGVSYPRLDGQNWVRMGWYLTPLGLLLATLGLAEVIRKERLGRIAVFLTIGVMTTVQYVYNVLNTPYHIYVMRRYVPVVIPMLMIFASVAILAVYRWRPTRVTAALSATLAVLLAGGMIYQARFVLPQRDYAGAVAQLEALSNEMNPDAVVIFAEPVEGTFSDTFGVPLHYIYGHDIITIREETADVPALLSELVDVDPARPVHLLAVDPVFDSVRHGITLKPHKMFPFSVEMLQNSFDKYPSVIQTAYYGIEIYDVEQKDDLTSAGDVERLRIDIGELDAAYIRDGFYAKELIPGAATMRWTADDASLHFPAPVTDELDISVRAMIYRPEATAAEPVTVWLDDTYLGEFTPDERWQTYAFTGSTVPSDGSSVLRFETKTFNPAALGVNADGRDLGFLLDEIVLETR